MHVLITGGTGSIGRRLANHLDQHGHVATILSRQSTKPAILPARINFVQWDGKTAEGWGHLVEDVDAIVNLAGASIAYSWWTKERKIFIAGSRINAGKAVAEAIRGAKNKPNVLIQASAVGYYGTDLELPFTESSPPGNDFLADLCRQWEASTEAVEAMGVRRVVIRTGLVLDTDDGAFPKMIMPFRFFGGGPMGNGLQWLSWIHYFDEVEAIRFLLETESVEGPVNLTAPQPLRNRNFAIAIGKAMNRPAILPAPSFALKLIFGEMSVILLEGQQVLPARLEEAGYIFKFPGVESALEDLL